MKVNLEAQKAHERGEDCGRDVCPVCAPPHNDPPCGELQSAVDYLEGVYTEPQHEIDFSDPYVMDEFQSGHPLNEDDY